MPYLFDHFRSAQELLSLAPVGLFTDIDGTISEIAPSPGAARVSSSCRESLAILARHLAVVAAVSGRPAAEARGMVGIDDMVYIGNHGYERWVGGTTELVPGVEDCPAKIKEVVDELARLLPLEGIIVEDKGPTATVHYRRCPDREAALKAIMSALEPLARAGNLRVSRGKMSVEIKPSLEVSKWTAVSSLIEEHGLRGALYLGDDLTDVDVFAGLHRKELPFRGLAVAVVGDETAPEVLGQADFELHGVGDVERFLTRAAAEVIDRPAS